MPLHIVYNPPRGWRNILLGEPVKKGDTYEANAQKCEVGTAGATITEGQHWPAEMMRHNPIRRVDPR